MYRFFETIRIHEGSVMNLGFHQQRMENTLNQNYKDYLIPCLNNIISIPSNSINGIVKCRVDYNNNDYSVAYESYIPKKVNSLKVVSDNAIIYNFKFTNRNNLIRLFQKRENCDDILIARNGYISDTSFSNIIFFDGKDWHTPSTPLLKGTCRARLLSVGKISEKVITLDDLQKYLYFKLINSMLNDDLTDHIPVSFIVL